MNKLEAVMLYLCQNYPYEHELSNSRLTKLVYLSDWFNCLINEKQISDISWIFNHYGPYVDDVMKTAEYSKYFEIEYQKNFYGNSKTLIKCKENQSSFLPEEEISVLDFVIKKTDRMYYNDFIDYVYSTYPVHSKHRYSTLDLISLANEFKTESLKQSNENR
ncbi:Panacea domain-containing protein [Psychrobacter frigidicola]|uniref:Panacea domain-containing protein n=1 Tax=Psychrobacter frigidicola TaxID=45611 RepID=UPI0019180375|nr:Panacea domain-containing protein [Psychrobacter frigidicola]